MPFVTTPFRALALLAAMSIASTLAVSPATAASFDEPLTAVDDRDDSARVPEASPALPFTSAAAGLVTGRLVVTTMDGGSDFVVADGGVEFFSSTFPFEFIRRASTNATGYFSVSGLGAGNYTVAFYSRQEPATPVREWYSQESFQFAASTVTLTTGTPRDFGTIVLGERDFQVARISGADRFATAVEVSEVCRDIIIVCGPQVFIVNGLNFPDALSAGALAARSGVLLLVGPNSIPAVVQAELDALDPAGITIVGGTGAVSNAVQTQLAAYVASPSLVMRVAGTDRYDTSRRIAAGGFDPVKRDIFIATGANFPDALSAVPAAGVTGGVVLLVNGSASRLDLTTRSLIGGLDPDRIHVIGGSGVVSNGIFADLSELAPTVNRFFGADRYATAVTVAQSFFPAADYAFLANGSNFPDALAAGPLAGQLDSPIYLSQRDCVPIVVYEDVFDVLANQIFGVGGTGVLTDSALAGIPC